MKVNSNENQFQKIKIKDLKYNEEERNIYINIDEKIKQQAKIRDQTQFHSNINVCQRYGQKNYENCLVTLIILTSLTGLILYYYFDDFLKIFLYMITFSALNDLIILFFYAYFYFNMKSELIHVTFQKDCFYSLEGINFFNFLLKVFNIVSLMIFNGHAFRSLFMFWLVVKSIYDLYFALISLKLFSFFSCTLKLQEFFSIIWESLSSCCTCGEKRHENLNNSKVEVLDSGYI